MSSANSPPPRPTVGFCLTVTDKTKRIFQCSLQFQQCHILWRIGFLHLAVISISTRGAVIPRCPWYQLLFYSAVRTTLISLTPLSQNRLSIIVGIWIHLAKIFWGAQISSLMGSVFLIKTKTLISWNILFARNLQIQMKKRDFLIWNKKHSKIRMRNGIYIGDAVLQVRLIM